MFDQSRVPWSDGPGPAADRPRAPRGAARAETAPVHRAPPERGGGRGGPPGGQGALTSRPVLPDPEPLPSQVRAASPSPRKHSSAAGQPTKRDRKSTRLNSSHVKISYAVFCLKKKK